MTVNKTVVETSKRKLHNSFFKWRHQPFILLFFYMLFITCWEDLSGIGSVLSHLDEVLFLVLFLYLICNYHFLSTKKIHFLWLWSLFWMTGFLSTCIHRYQPLVPSMVDGVIITNKFVVGYLSSVVFCKKHDVAEILRMINLLSKLITIVLFALSVHDAFLSPIFPIDYHSKSIGFLFTQRLFFYHPTYLAFAGVTLLLVISFHSKYSEDVPYKLMLTFLIFVTFRAKAIGFIFIYWLLLVYFFMVKQRKILYIVIPALLGIIVLAKDKIVTYFMISTRFSPRNILLKDSIMLAKNHFPFGTGFGTFASNISARYYSSLYYGLGYDQLRGMGLNGDTSFLSDSFWPCIIGQFGFLGLALFVVIVFRLLQTAIGKLKRDKNTGFVMLMALAYLLITSVAETSFFNPAAFLIAILFGAFEMKKVPRHSFVTCVYQNEGKTEYLVRVN